MTDIAHRVASLADDRLLALHKSLDEGDPRDPVDIEAHHLVAVEMLRRGHQHGHDGDPWAHSAVVTDEVEVDGPDDIEAPEGFDEVWEAALSQGGSVSVVLTADGYILKAQPSPYQPAPSSVDQAREGALTLPDGSTYTPTPATDPVAKHGSPDRPGYAALHPGSKAGGAKGGNPAGANVGGALTDSSRTYPRKVQYAIDSKPRVIQTQYGQIDDTMSAWHHMLPDGQGGFEFTSERQAIHDRIIDEHLNGVTTGQAEPVMVLMGGGGGSGKGTLIKSGLLGDTLPTDRVHIDADEIKMQLPEYGVLVKSGHKTEVANYVHEESSIVSKAVQRRAEENRSHIVLDGTGDSNRESLQGKIDKPRAQGYTVRAEYVTAPISTGVYDPPGSRGAWERNVERAASGPRGLVVPSAIISAHTSVSRLVPEMAGQFDSFRLWDTTNADGAGPVLIGTATRGSTVAVTDAARYATFLAKGQSTLSPDALMSTISPEQWTRIREATE